MTKSRVVGTTLKVDYLDIQPQKQMELDTHQQEENDQNTSIVQNILNVFGYMIKMTQPWGGVGIPIKILDNLESFVCYKSIFQPKLNDLVTSDRLIRWRYYPWTPTNQNNEGFNPNRNNYGWNIISHP